MYTPPAPKLPSAFAAAMAGVTMIFMTVAPEAENRIYGGDSCVAVSVSAPVGLCATRSVTGCQPIRA